MSSPQDGEVPPGFNRRIRLFPYADRIVVALEDNLHRFTMELSHADGVVRDIQVEAERYPWTTCAEAPAFLREQAIGQKLEDVARLDVFKHCTHLFELAVLGATHAGDTAPTQFDLHVDDWADKRTRVQLLVDRQPVLDLSVNGLIVETPGDWQGRNLLQIAHPSRDPDPVIAEQAMLVGRAIYVSLGRATPPVERASDRGPAVVGVCFSYQAAKIGEALRMDHSRKEFVGPLDQPLQDFDPELALR